MKIQQLMIWNALLNFLRRSVKRDKPPCVILCRGPLEARLKVEERRSQAWLVGCKLDDFIFELEGPHIRIIHVHADPYPPSFKELSRTFHLATMRVWGFIRVAFGYRKNGLNCARDGIVWGFESLIFDQEATLSSYFKASISYRPCIKRKYKSLFSTNVWRGYLIIDFLKWLEWRSPPLLQISPQTWYAPPTQ